MKANELRIGNYVFENGKIKILYSISAETAKDYSKVKSIPLTKEWLTRLGFRKRNDCEWIYEKFPILVNCGNHNLVHIIATENTFTMPVQIGGYNVHQLQNLYFSLTGEELQIEK